MTEQITHRERQKQQTRRLILECAYELFEERGYEKTTMRALADRAGVALGTIFKHFPDKNALLVAAFADDVGALVRRAFVSAPPSGIKEQLVHLTREFYSYYAARPILADLLVKQAARLELSGRSPIRDQWDEFLDDASRLYREAQERGELDSDFNSRDAVMVFGSIYLMVLVRGLGGDRFDIEAQVGLVERLLEHHLRGLGHRPVHRTAERR